MHLSDAEAGASPFRKKNVRKEETSLHIATGVGVEV
jgi:hypothetical protein